MSNETTHTPGPWEVEGGPLGDAAVIADADGRWVADSGLFDRAPGETQANARLIAAAPDLLEAAKAALLDVPCDGDPCRHCALRAAIVKAEGRDS